MFRGNLVNVKQERKRIDQEIASAIEDYDRPYKAQQIWARYQTEIKRYGCMVEAIRILTQVNKVDTLDARLALMLSQMDEEGRAIATRTGRFERGMDSFGQYANARRCLE